MARMKMNVHFATAEEKEAYEALAKLMLGCYNRGFRHGYWRAGFELLAGIAAGAGVTKLYERFKTPKKIEDLET